MTGALTSQTASLLTKHEEWVDLGGSTRGHVRGKNRQHGKSRYDTRERHQIMWLDVEQHAADESSACESAQHACGQADASQL